MALLFVILSNNPKALVSIDYKAKTPSDRNRGGEKSDDALAL